MQIQRRGRTAVGVFGITATLAASGCAHHRADQYTYAPPYAPPVYPQPAGYGQPAAYAAQPAATVLPALPVGNAPVATPVAATTAAPGEVIVASGSPCPPCGPHGTAGVVVGGPTMIGGDGQTPPCPPGP